jgi:CRP/FNR family transcriptional regulator, cyclic AMP receptor protein
VRVEEIVRHLCTTTIFQHADKKRVTALATKAEALQYQAGDRILVEGQPSNELYVLIEGVVGVFYSSQDGNDVLVKIFGAPAAFGEMELIFRQPRQEYVECFEPAQALKLPADAFLAFMKEDAEACYAMLKDVSCRLAIAAYHERALAFLDTNTRLAGLFLSFLEAYGERTDQGIRLRIKLSYEMLARCLGVTVRSIDRAMAEWAKEGFMIKEKGVYYFTRLDALQDKADPDRLALFSTLGLTPHTSGELFDDTDPTSG